MSWVTNESRLDDDILVLLESYIIKVYTYTVLNFNLPVVKISHGIK